MYEEMRSRGLETPLDRAPRLDEHEAWLLGAYVQCAAARGRDGSGRPAPVPLSEIAAWLDIHAVCRPEDRAEVAAAVLAADAAVRANASAKE